ncbi:hypothetical protein C882_3513 [Caenispirillum salinarum AK4]|uniref:PRC-barrel domain-containing protein n=1 Tax=Caenispirillum salinarum AK4 TaxID=1238182 RepID=K9H2G3_9PROT|nr:hypothetical protein [Caenispirillum salinarum]EKV31762.1 hypothetical protein C882_3513 [Caenispirillum salinarum AK4]
MRHTTLAAGAAAIVIAAAGTASAQGNPTCDQQITWISQAIPNISHTDASARLNISEEHLEGALSALDAARLANQAGESETCMTLANAAEGMLTRGGWSPDGERPAGSQQAAAGQQGQGGQQQGQAQQQTQAQQTPAAGEDQAVTIGDTQVQAADLSGREVILDGARIGTVVDLIGRENTYNDAVVRLDEEHSQMGYTFAADSPMAGEERPIIVGGRTLAVPFGALTVAEDGSLRLSSDAVTTLDQFRAGDGPDFYSYRQGQTAELPEYE